MFKVEEKHLKMIENYLCSECLIKNNKDDNVSLFN
jgi:hypothetical protein